MIAPTHMTFSLFIYLLLITPTGIALSWTNAAAATLASVLPDLDTQSSTIGKHLRFISRPIEARFGHRTLTHSLLFVAGVFVVFLPIAWWQQDLYYCFCVGYATHPLIDTMTVNGVRLFYPISAHKCVFPMDVNHPHRYRAQTGGRSDILLGVAFLLLSLPAYLVAQAGYERFVRITQGSIESAVRDYNDMSRTHRVYADILAHNLVTKRSLSGRVELLGSIDEQTLVFRGLDGKIHTLGMEYRSDYAADRAVAERGEAVNTNVFDLDLSGRRLKELERMLDDSSALLFGTLAVDRAPGIPEPDGGFQTIRGQTGSVRLAYATVGEIMEAGLGEVLVVRGTLTVSHTHSSIREGTTDVTHLPQFATDLRPGRASTGRREMVQAHRPARSFTLTAGSGEQIVRVQNEGDSVSIGDTLAVRKTSPEARAQLESLRADLRRLSTEILAQRASYRERLGELIEKCRRDSQDLALAARLHVAGFAASVSIDSKKAALARSGSERRRLRAAYRRDREQMHARMAGIEESILNLQRADSLAHAMLRSPVSGSILSVREFKRGDGMHIVFSIETPGP